MKKINYKEVIEIVCRLYVFFFLTLYGLGKLIGGQFYSAETMPEGLDLIPIGQVSDFDLAWVFMGRSYGYMLFIGIGEVIGALMLLHNKTKLIGTFILIPIMINVVVFDIFFLDEYGALVSAILYLMMLLSILWINKAKIIEVGKALTHFDPITKTSMKERFVKFSYVLLLVIIVVFAFNQSLVSWLGYERG